MSSNVPDHLRHLETLTSTEIEQKIQSFRERDPKSLSDDDLEMVVSLHTIARRKTAGPPKPKTALGPKKQQEVSLDDLLGGLKLGS